MRRQKGPRIRDREAIQSLVANQFAGVFKARQSRRERLQSVKIAAEQEVAALEQQSLGRLSRVHMRRVAEALQVSLKQHAKLDEEIDDGRILLNGAHPLWMGEDDLQVERLEVADGRRDEI